MSECKHPKCCGCALLDKWVNRDGSRADKCYLDSCRHNAASEKRTKRCHYKPPDKTRLSERASRHRAFAMRLVLGLLMATRDEFAKLSDLGLFQRAARRWLKVMEGKR